MSQSDTLLDHLAVALHGGWPNYVGCLGFSLGPTRNDAAQTHPGLKILRSAGDLEPRQRTAADSRSPGRLVELHLVGVTDLGRIADAGAAW